MVADSNVQDNWVLDLGCTFHMTPMKELFEVLKPADGCMIQGDEKTC